MTDISIILLWLILWFVFAMFPRKSAAVTAFAGTLIFVFQDVGIGTLTLIGVKLIYLFLYAVLLLDLGRTDEK